MSDTLTPSPENGMDHLDEMTCLLYLERQLDRARGQQVSEHLQHCAACRILMHALERESRLLTRAMFEEAEPLPARLAHFQQRSRKSMQWIWGVAFALAATGIYALYTGYIAPWQTQLDQAGFGGTNLLTLLIFQGALWKGWQSMLTVFEVLALVTLAVFGLAFFRRRMRRGSALALVLGGLCAAMLHPGASVAGETHSGNAASSLHAQVLAEVARDVEKKVRDDVKQNVHKQVQAQVQEEAGKQVANSVMRKGESVGVGKDEVINGDIFLTGERVRVDGTVTGDVYVFAHNAVINGHVEGDVIGFVQMMEVNGKVDGNIRSACNTLTVRGTVAKNVLTFDQTLDLDSAGKVGGSITAFAENFRIDGSAERELLVFAKHLSVSGKVGGGIRMRGDELSINSGAEVDGPIHYDGNNPPEVSSSAKLVSPVDYHKLEKKPSYMEGHYYVWQVIWMAAFILFGMVLFLLMPKFSAEAIADAARYGPAFGLGILVMFGFPIAALIACITVVGLFIGISGLLLWYAALYYGMTIVGAVVGQWIMGKTRELWPLIGRMAVGVVIIRLCTLIPEAGGWIKFALYVWGLGGISLALYRRFAPVIAPPSTSTGAYTSALPPQTTVGGTQPA